MNPLEYEECIIFTDWLNIMKSLGKIVDYAHIPNGTYTPSWNQKRKNARLGVSAGFPDYAIITRGRHLLFVEMKRVKGGRVSEEQEFWLKELGATGAYTTVAQGANQAIKFVEQFI